MFIIYFAQKSFNYTLSKKVEESNSSIANDSRGFARGQTPKVSEKMTPVWTASASKANNTPINSGEKMKKRD